ncbi:oxidoreductase [Streptomyces nitrosporeus]|uniref:Oxidoreductase n=1 Tax=Streptomyces nitrosporeus TaxID=28894 RepID=A0A5J6FIF6_9ACTN|nr:FAD-binding oxidoreductase [Streptomyces nitrosporeus]QEU75274.1 oxidoreductase [Streptomyces nitrosporeus]GGZ30413.1 oxidoreductase [Streptomyces nitrosporeus]
MSAWHSARLVGRREQSRTGRTLLFDVPGWPGHLAGQHVDVRLSADDGYRAVRSYSLAAPARGTGIELGVQTVPGGEVSPYLAHELPVGAEVEVRGPLGGWFVWRPGQEDPVLLVAGGCGIVPLMGMVRSHRLEGSRAPMRLVYSVRDPGQVWYREELTTGTGAAAASRILYTRQAPPGSSRPPGHIGAGDLLPPEGAGRLPVLCFVCGPTGFVEHAAGLLSAAGHAPDRIRTERFG